MTKRECSIVMAFTGICTLQGDDINIYYEYLEKLFVRPVLSHEIPDLYLEIKTRSSDDFTEMCKNATEN